MMGEAGVSREVTQWSVPRIQPAAWKGKTKLMWFGSSFPTLGGRFGIIGFQSFSNLHEEEQERRGRRQQLSSD